MKAQVRLLRWTAGLPHTQIVLQADTTPELSAELTRLLRTPDLHLELEGAQLYLEGLEPAGPRDEAEAEAWRRHEQRYGEPHHVTVDGVRRTKAEWDRLLGYDAPGRSRPWGDLAHVGPWIAERLGPGCTIDWSRVDPARAATHMGHVDGLEELALARAIRLGPESRGRLGRSAAAPAAAAGGSR